MKRVLSLASVYLVATACGQAKDSAPGASSGPSAAALFADNESSAVLATSNVSEGLDNAVAGEDSTSADMNLMTELESQKFTKFVKTCEVKDGDAVVKVESAMDKQKTRTNKNISLTMKKSGSSWQTRTWSKEGADLACNAEGKNAEIDWTNPQGLSVVVEVERDRTFEMTLENLKRGTTRTRSHSFLMNGKRTVTWLEASTQDSTLIRKKQISSEVTRELEFKNSKGEEVKKEISIKTDAEKPLVVEVTRDAASPFALKSKKIISGKVIASFKDGGSVNTSFDNLKFEVDADAQCGVVAGKFSVEFMSAEGSSVKTYSCSVEDSDLSCTDSNGSAVVVDAPDCDEEDLH